MNITKEQFKELAKKHLTALQGYDVNETIEIFGAGKLYNEIVESEKLTLPAVINSVCECEPHTFYEWEKDQNKCCQCNKPIHKQTISSNDVVGRSEQFFCCKEQINQRCSEQCLGCFQFENKE